MVVLMEKIGAWLLEVSFLNSRSRVARVANLVKGATLVAVIVDLHPTSLETSDLRTFTAMVSDITSPVGSDSQLAWPLSSQCLQVPVTKDASYLPFRQEGIICPSPYGSSAPSSSRDHQSSSPSEHDSMPDSKVSIPMDVPAARIPKDPLVRPTMEAEINDVYRYAGEGKKVILGPIPVQAFLDEFLPPAPADVPMPNCARAFSKVPLRPQDEREICEALVRCYLV